MFLPIKPSLILLLISPSTLRSASKVLNSANCDSNLFLTSDLNSSIVIFSSIIAASKLTELERLAISSNCVFLAGVNNKAELCNS